MVSENLFPFPDFTLPFTRREQFLTPTAQLVFVLLTSRNSLLPLDTLDSKISRPSLCPCRRSGRFPRKEYPFPALQPSTLKLHSDSYPPVCSGPALSVDFFFLRRTPPPRPSSPFGFSREVGFREELILFFFLIWKLRGSETA